MDPFYLSVQGLVQMELIFFITAYKVLGFRQVTRTLLITHNNGLVIAVPAQCQGLLHLLLCYPVSRLGLEERVGRGDSWDSSPKLTKDTSHTI